MVSVFAALAVRWLQHTSLTAMNVQADLADVQRRLRALQKKCSKRRLMQECTQKARRCAPTSRACLFVFAQSGRATEVAVDFVSGRGWNTSGQLLDEQEREELAAEIEWVYIRAPLEDIVMLETKRKSCAAGKISLLEHDFLVEHMLFAWQQRQNVEQDLAPSRSVGSCKHPYSHARRQISPALGGSAGHFEALQHFAFEGKAKQDSDVVLYQFKGYIWVCLADLNLGPFLQLFV